MHANHLTRAPFAGYAIEFHMILATAVPRQSIGYLYGASGGRLEVRGGLDAKVIGLLFRRCYILPVPLSC